MKVWIAYRDDGYEGNTVLGVSHTLSTAMLFAQADAKSPIEWEKPESDSWVEGWSLVRYALTRTEVRM